MGVNRMYPDRLMILIIDFDARDCCNGNRGDGQHELLQHNLAELARLCERIRPILFPVNA